jgi:hypothetical protein
MKGKTKEPTSIDKCFAEDLSCQLSPEKEGREKVVEAGKVPGRRCNTFKGSEVGVCYILGIKEKAEVTARKSGVGGCNNQDRKITQTFK